MAQEKTPAKEQSMEEILQSIKRIIAEENDGSSDAPAVSSGSDVLELTDLIDDPVAEDAPAKPVAEMPKAATPAPTPVPPPPPVAKPAAPIHQEESELLVALPISKPAAEGSKDVLKDIDSLLSDETRKASSAMMKSLSETKKPVSAPIIHSTPSMEFRSGNTVEDLVMEALKPMLKDWLDANLLQIVEKLVQKEINKINS